jgi:TolA-binding protein
MICINCKGENRDNAKFCRYCGTPLDAQGAVLSEPAAPVAEQTATLPETPALVYEQAAAVPETPVLVAAQPTESPEPPAFLAEQPAPQPQGEDFAAAPYPETQASSVAVADLPQNPAQAACCSVCGNPLRPGAGFCNRCGTPVATPSSAPPPFAMSGYAVPIKQKKPVNKKTLAIVLACAAFVVLAVVGIIVGISVHRSNLYDSALALLDSGSYQEAMAIFVELEDYQDAAANATLCRQNIDYLSATALFDSGSYEEAKNAFTALDLFKDSADMAQTCQQHLDYIAADALFQNGEFFAAYMIFDDLYGFQDSDDRALACIQPTPENGEYERNPDYSGGDIHVDIENENSNDMFVKFYDNDETFVKSAYIGANSTATIYLPSGLNYSIRYASGYFWFGDQDMFGDGGEYSQFEFESGVYTMYLPGNVVWTISFGILDGNAGSVPIGRDGF